MAVKLVLSVIATDRPGLVQVLAEAIAGNGGNWIDSSMARLAGEVAGIVLVSVPDQSVAALEAALDELGDQGIAVTTRRSDVTGAPTGRSAILELTGSDQPGIVRDVSAALAKHGASIDELETHLFPGSMSGEKMFSAKARIILPEQHSADRLRDELEAIAADIMVEIDLKDEAGDTPS